ncbi:MAG: hypothetical protein LBR08_03715, partial [Bacteroidales bacterium]|nr:hypothetical protein [Bacteroidales bacterium]
ILKDAIPPSVLNAVPGSPLIRLAAAWYAPRENYSIGLSRGNPCRGCAQPCIDAKRRRRYPLITPYEMRGTTG